MTTEWSSVLFQALMSKSWNAVFWLWAIRACSRGPWSPDWLPGKWSGGAEVRSGFEPDGERVAKGHRRVGRVK